MKSGCVFPVVRTGNGQCSAVLSPLARGIRVWASREGLPNRSAAFFRVRNSMCAQDGPSIRISAVFDAASTDLGHV
jgi:hypothetical protein